MQRAENTLSGIDGGAYASRMVKTATWSHGSDLRSYREQNLGISQQAAATRVGVSIGAYSAWERGTAIPKLESLAELGERLGVPPEVVGYRAPAGWELVPAAWIRERHEEQMVLLRSIAKHVGSPLGA